MSLCLRQYFHRCFQTGLQLRTAVVAAVYEKSLTLAISERQIRSSGEITNLMSVDAQRLQVNFSLILIIFLDVLLYKFLTNVSLCVGFNIVPTCSLVFLFADWLGNIFFVELSWAIMFGWSRDYCDYDSCKQKCCRLPKSHTERSDGKER